MPSLFDIIITKKNESIRRIKPVIYAFLNPMMLWNTAICEAAGMEV